jgi:hypothetical protein
VWESRALRSGVTCFINHIKIVGTYVGSID